MKNIVVCCDGTGAQYGHTKTNVVKLFEAIVRDQEQVAFYDPGVGTAGYTWRKITPKIELALSEAFGAGLRQNIEDGYKYLMDTYEMGDKVFLFGFSRGTHTVRSLAGMLRKCGLLEKGSNNLVSYTSKHYLKRGDDDVVAGFKQTYSRECKPHFLGVWDTVAAMGWFWGNEFPDNILNHDVPYGYQALAIDEKRKHFVESVWDETARAEHQVIEQVWFAGFHADVGGWHVDAGISDIALKWMLEHAQSKGLRVREGALDELNPDPSGMLHQSRNGMWRIFRPRVRHIPECSKLHESVFSRVEDPANSYRPGNLPNQYQKIMS